MKHNTQFFVEYFALDLIMASDGKFMTVFLLLLSLLFGVGQVPLKLIQHVI